MNVFVKVSCLAILLSAAAGWQPTDAERAQILEAHHRIREKVDPTASNMKLLRYSRDLEHLAAYWAGECKFRRPDTKKRRRYRDLGMNLAITFGSKPALVDGLCSWLSESNYYTYANNTCSRSCSQYTQLIWAQATEVGCAMRECNGVIHGMPDPQYITVCLYKPSGNYRKGKPYLCGPSCSGCSKWEQCYRNQCMRDAQLREVHPMDSFSDPNDKYVPQCVPPKSDTIVAAASCEST